jgi:hypothetical protein
VGGGSCGLVSCSPPPPNAAILLINLPDPWCLAVIRVCWRSRKRSLCKDPACVSANTVWAEPCRWELLSVRLCICRKRDICDWRFSWHAPSISFAICFLFISIIERSISYSKYCGNPQADRHYLHVGNALKSIYSSIQVSDVLVRIVHCSLINSPLFVGIPARFTS